MKKVSILGLLVVILVTVIWSSLSNQANDKWRVERVAEGVAKAKALVIKSATQPKAAMSSTPSEVNIYSATTAGKLSLLVKDHLSRIYVPNLRSNNVSVIDPQTMQVLGTITVGYSPQHVVPSWDLRTLWVANNAERRTDGSLTPIDPRTAKASESLDVDDPYNMYFLPDGKSAIIVAEARHRLDFRDPTTMQLQYSIEVPKCAGINHGDFSFDGKYALFTCEFSGDIAKIDLEKRQVAGYLKLTLPKTRFKEVPRSVGVINPTDLEICSADKGMPQDIRSSPDGKRFYVADMEADGVHVIDGNTLTKLGFIPTGVAAHGIYPSRDGKQFYVSNRGSHQIHGKPNGKGSVTVIDFASEKIVAQWPIPGGGSPDMGNVSSDGKYLWLSGRFDDEVYRIDTGNGQVAKIPVGKEPHGLTVWPQPGRYSLGHTGNLR